MVADSTWRLSAEWVHGSFIGRGTSMRDIFSFKEGNGSINRIIGWTGWDFFWFYPVHPIILLFFSCAEAPLSTKLPYTRTEDALNLRYDVEGQSRPSGRAYLRTSKMRARKVLPVHGKGLSMRHFSDFCPILESIGLGIRSLPIKKIISRELLRKTTSSFIEKPLQVN